MKLETLEDVLVDELQDIYHAEKQITKALPKMAKAANSEDLRNALQQHLEQTRHQIERLERVFESMGRRVKAKACRAMQGLIEENDEVLEAVKKSPAADAAIICAAQKIEHYEIASYGSARTHARQLGLHQQAQMLQETLDEEGQADERLTQIAESHANVHAAEAGEGEDGSESESSGERSSRQEREM